MRKLVAYVHVLVCMHNFQQEYQIEQALKSIRESTVSLSVKSSTELIGKSPTGPNVVSSATSSSALVSSTVDEPTTSSGVPPGQ